MPSDGNLAKQKHMFTFNTTNYHTINNFGKSHLSIWIGNTSDLEETSGAPTLPNPKSGITLLLDDILRVSSADDTQSPGEGATGGSPVGPGSRVLEPALCSSFLMSLTPGATGFISVGPEQRKRSFAILHRNTFPTLGKKASCWGISLLQGP